MPTVNRGVFRWLFAGGATIDDMSGRLNHVWTVFLLLILAAIVSWKQGASDPILCWIPPEFSQSMANYANSKCWNSYAILYPEPSSREFFPVVKPDIPYVSRGGGEDSKTTYYQWIPVIVVFQALLFKLPNILFYILHSYSGISFTKLYGLTEGSHNLNLEDRVSLSKQIGRYIFVWCKTSFPSGVPWRMLTVLTFFMKILYCVNIVCQLVLVDRFLSTKSVDNATSFGELIYDNIEKNNATFWRESPPFPRVILCDFKIRLLGNMHPFTLQCELPANYFIERACMLLWVWLVVVAAATVLSFLVWVPKTILPYFRKRYIMKFLEMHEDRQTFHSSDFEVQKFAGSFLGEDGVVVLKLIAANSSDLIVKDAVIQVLKMYVPHRPAGSSPPVGQVSPAGYSETAMSSIVTPVFATAPPTSGDDSSQYKPPPQYPSLN